MDSWLPAPHPSPVASTPEPSQRVFNLDEARSLPASRANAQDSSPPEGLLGHDADAVTQVVKWAGKGDDSDRYFPCSYRSTEPPTTHFPTLCSSDSRISPERGSLSSGTTSGSACGGLLLRRTRKWVPVLQARGKNGQTVPHSHPAILRCNVGHELA